MTLLVLCGCAGVALVVTLLVAGFLEELDRATGNRRAGRLGRLLKGSHPDWRL